MVDNDCFVKKRGNDKIVKLHLFYNDYETSYVIQLIIIMLVGTDFLRSDGLPVGGNRSTNIYRSNI